MGDLDEPSAKLRLSAESTDFRKSLENRFLSYLFGISGIIQNGHGSGKDRFLARMHETVESFLVALANLTDQVGFIGFQRWSQTFHWLRNTSENEQSLSTPGRRERMNSIAEGTRRRPYFLASRTCLYLGRQPPDKRRDYAAYDITC
jgi:hypothetical protein